MTGPGDLAIVGAGWAGLAAAVAATQRGLRVTVHEAARSVGGRARGLDVGTPDGRTLRLDNGQHILIGAYRDTLRMMEAVGVSPTAVLHRLPLALRFPDGTGLSLPSWPAPLDAAAGILGAAGWSWPERLSLLRASLAWRRAGFACPDDWSVQRLTATLPARVQEDLVEPLCVAALNTPAAQASGRVFLRVMRDALFGAGHGGWGGSNLRLPRVDLGRVFPEAAWDWLGRHGAELHPGHRVQVVAAADGADWQGGGWRVDDRRFRHVLLACPSWEAARLAAGAGHAAQPWRQAASALQHEAIATVYATGGPALPCPMLALRSGPQAPAQFVFDRGQLGGPAGLLAFVASACTPERETVERQVIAQAQALGWRASALQTVVEKRATFACTPGLRRPAARIAPGLWACGDYVDGPYPATLEGAVRSALQAVDAISAEARTTGPGH